MTLRRGAVPGLIAGVLVAAGAAASGGLHAVLAALPALLIVFSLLLGRSAGVEALVELAEALHGRDRRPAAAPFRRLASGFNHVPLAARPMTGGVTRRGPPLASPRHAIVVS